MKKKCQSMLLQRCSKWWYSIVTKSSTSPNKNACENKFKTLKNINIKNWKNDATKSVKSVKKIRRKSPKKWWSVFLIRFKKQSCQVQKVLNTFKKLQWVVSKWCKKTFTKNKKVMTKCQ